MTFDRSPSRPLDALVVGGRCAGAAVALLMARGGMSVRLVERARRGTDTMSTHALMRGAVMLLARWGVLDRIRARGAPPVRGAVFTYGDERLEIPFKPSPEIDALYAPRRHSLDAVLADAAEEAGARVDFEVSCEALLRDASGRVTGAVLRHADGTTEEVRADLVIGADGLGSVVAREVAAPLTHAARHASSILYGYWQGLGGDVYEWSYSAGGATGTIPTNDGESCVFVAVPPGTLKALAGMEMPAAYRRLLSRHAPQPLQERLSRGRLEGPVRRFGGRTGFLRQPVGAGWALVGDAGYFKDPLTAHGITDALRDAALLAEAALGGAARDLARYEAERDALSVALFEATDRIASFDWSMDQLRSLHLELNAAMKIEAKAIAERLAAHADLAPRALAAADRAA